MKPRYEDMHPVLQVRYDAFKAIADQIEHLPYALNCVLRVYDEQLALHAQGRETLSVVNTLRTKAGMQPISESENKSKVTWTMNSKHFPVKAGKVGAGTSRAFDVVVLKNGRTASWDLKWDADKDQIPDYEELALIAEQVGLVAGGHAFGDWPHFQLPDDIA
jgi:hypothetical protein